MKYLALILAFFVSSVFAGVVNAPNDHMGMMMMGAPEVNAGSLMVPTPGSTVPRIQDTTITTVANTDIGAFRTTCKPSHMAFDDPIVKPGLPGQSHLHLFFGATDTNAFTKQANFAGMASTCMGGTLNRSSYWVPAMVDVRTGAPIVPKDILIYYKQGYSLSHDYDGKFQPVPLGLKMVAGSMANSVDVSATDPWAFSPYSHICLQPNKHTQQIPECAVGDEMWSFVTFPQCWDGVNLDSPDHKSHMHYPANGACPATHPVALPELTYIVEYKITEPGNSTWMRLSSDGYDKSLPPGRSMHADYWMNWDPATMQQFVDACVNAKADCHNDLLNNGKILY